MCVGNMTGCVEGMMDVTGVCVCRGHDRVCRGMTGCVEKTRQSV